MPFLGEFAAIAAALAFSVTSTMFTLAGRQYGPILTMRGSLPIAFLMLVIWHWLVYGVGLPIYAEPERWLLLGVSGIAGFWLGSVAIMNAFIRIGPRLTLLISSIGPILSAILAWLLLDEYLDGLAILGIVLTVGGIGLVVTENGDKNGSKIHSTDAGAFTSGILFAILGSLFQAVSFILSKEGLSGHFTPETFNLVGILPLEHELYQTAINHLSPLSGSVIRIAIGAIGIWLAPVARGRVLIYVHTLTSKRVALRWVSLASVTGPVVGASLVMVALSNAPVGIATTLTNLTPIFLIPIGYVVFQERITSRSIVGTLVAVVGTAVLFL